MRFLRIENLHVVLYIFVLSLMILSLALVYSASVRYSEVIGLKNDPHELAMKHAAKTVFALILLVIASKLPLRFWKDFTHIFMMIAVGLLIAVLIIGEKRKELLDQLISKCLNFNLLLLHCMQ